MKEEKGKQGGQKGKLKCDIISSVAAGDLTASPETEMIVQSLPQSRQESQVFMMPPT